MTQKEGVFDRLLLAGAAPRRYQSADIIGPPSGAVKGTDLSTNGRVERINA
jgi:hypothetical protein